MGVACTEVGFPFLYNKMKLLLVTLAVSVVSAGVITNAYTKKQQFYPTVVYIITSSRSMSVLYVQAFLLLWHFIKFCKIIFFGTLRAIEVEHLIERSWFGVLDTFILLAAFHEEMNPTFVGLVVLLFILKSFHWLSSDRVDHMEQSPFITWKFHIRAISLLALLIGADLLFVRRAWSSLNTRGLSVDIVFGLEYAIMLTEVLKILAKYILHTIDLRSPNPWENKPIYIRYIDIFLGIIELLLYAGYMVFMLMVPFIPLHIARRVYRAARDFHRSIHDVMTSHQAIRNLNTLYPDVSEEQLQADKNVCIICREDMIQRCKKLPCGHVFHTSCLRSWFQRQHTCPTCRMDVLNNNNVPHPNQAPPQPPNQRQVPRNNINIFPPPPPHPQIAWPPQFPPVQPQQMGGAQQPMGGAQQQPGGVQPQPMGGAQQQPGGAQQPIPMSPPLPFTGPPPFVPLFPPPFIPPPPLINAHNDDVLKSLLQNFTDEQLKELEGNERANVEARILLLRNIQQLLDAAVLQMNQYSTIMASMSFPKPTSSSPNIETPSADDQSSFVPSGVQGSPHVEDEDERDRVEDIPPGSSEKRRSVDIPDSELIRQRRLQRFNSLPVTSSLNFQPQELINNNEDNDDEKDQ